MSLPSNELTATASTEYIGKATRTGEESTYRFLEPELQRKLRELQTLAMSVSEDYTLSMGKARSLVKRREVLKTIEALKEVMLTIPSMLRDFVEVSLKEIVMNSLRELGAPVLDVEIRYGEGIGLYALAMLDCDARRALEYWLKIVDSVREYNMPVFVTWTGNTDVTPEEMGTYIGKALARMNVFLATEKPLDIVKIIEEEWGL